MGARPMSGREVASCVGLVVVLVTIAWLTIALVVAGVAAFTEAIARVIA